METKIACLILISIAVSVISLTVTKAKVFTWFRDWIYDMAKNGMEVSISNGSGPTKSFSKMWSFLYELCTCPFCFSFYPSALLTYAYLNKINILNQLVGLDWMVTWFGTVGIAGIFTGIIYFLLSKIE